MTWFGWIMIVACVFGMYSALEQPTEERAALVLIINALTLAGLLFVGTGHI